MRDRWTISRRTALALLLALCGPLAAGPTPAADPPRLLVDRVGRVDDEQAADRPWGSRVVSRTVVPRPTFEQPLAGLDVRRFRGPHAAAAAAVLRRPLLTGASRPSAVTVHPPLVEWLIANPQFAAKLWQDMDVPVADIAVTADGWSCREANDTLLQFHEVMHQPGRRVIHCHGDTAHPLRLGNVEIDAVVVQQYLYLPTGDGRYRLAQRLHGYVTARGAGVKAALHIADDRCREFLEASLESTVIYFTVVARLLEHDPTWRDGKIAAILRRDPSLVSPIQRAALGRALATLPVQRRTGGRTAASAPPQQIR